MDALTQLRACHEALLKQLEGVSDPEATLGVVTKTWNLKDLLGHLVAYEHLLGEAISIFTHKAEDKPYLDKYIKQGREEFDKFENAELKNLVYHELFMNYISAHDYAVQMASNIPPSMFSKPGTLPWFGASTTVQDFITESCRHKERHIEEIRLFREQFKNAHVDKKRF